MDHNVLVSWDASVNNFDPIACRAEFENVTWEFVDLVQGMITNRIAIDVPGGGAFYPEQAEIERHMIDVTAFGQLNKTYLPAVVRLIVRGHM